MRIKVFLGFVVFTFASSFIQSMLFGRASVYDEEYKFSLVISHAFISLFQGMIIYSMFKSKHAISVLFGVVFSAIFVYMAYYQVPTYFGGIKYQQQNIDGIFILKGYAFGWFYTLTKPVFLLLGIFVAKSENKQ